MCLQSVGVGYNTENKVKASMCNPGYSTQATVARWVTEGDITVDTMENLEEGQVRRSLSFPQT
jgi:hypothetical protein